MPAGARRARRQPCSPSRCWSPRPRRDAAGGIRPRRPCARGRDITSGTPTPRSRSDRQDRRLLRAAGREAPGRARPRGRRAPRSAAQDRPREDRAPRLELTRAAALHPRPSTPSSSTRPRRPPRAPRREPACAACIRVRHVSPASVAESALPALGAPARPLALRRRRRRRRARRAARRPGRREPPASPGASTGWRGRPRRGPQRCRRRCTAPRWPASSPAGRPRRPARRRAGRALLAIQVLALRDGGARRHHRDLLAGLERAADPNADGDLPTTRASSSPRSPAPFAGFDESPEARAIAGSRHARHRGRRAARQRRPDRRPLGTLATPAARAGRLAVGASDGRPALPQVGCATAPVPPSSSRAALPWPARWRRSPARRCRAATPAPRDDGSGRARRRRLPGRRHALVAGNGALVPRDGGTSRAKASAGRRRRARRVLVVYGADALPAGALGVDDRVADPGARRRRRARPRPRPGARGRAQVQRHLRPAPATRRTLTRRRRRLLVPRASAATTGPSPTSCAPGVAIITSLPGGGYGASDRHLRRRGAGRRHRRGARRRPPGLVRARLRGALVSTAGSQRRRRARSRRSGPGRRPRRRAAAAGVTLATEPGDARVRPLGADGARAATLVCDNPGRRRRTVALGFERDGSARRHRPHRAPTDPAGSCSRPAPPSTLPRGPAARRRRRPARRAGGWIVALARRRRGPARAAGRRHRAAPALVPLRTAKLDAGACSPGAARRDADAARSAAVAPRRRRRARIAPVRSVALDLVPRRRAGSALLYAARDLLPGPLPLHPAAARAPAATLLAPGALPARRRASSATTAATARRTLRRSASGDRRARRCSTAHGCHLCEPAKATVRDGLPRGSACPLEEVDITGDAELEARYRTSLPVVEIDGRRAFKYLVDEDDLEQRLRRRARRLTAGGTRTTRVLVRRWRRTQRAGVYAALCCYEMRRRPREGSSRWHPIDSPSASRRGCRATCRCSPRRRRWAATRSPRRRSPSTPTSTRRRSAATSRRSGSSASAASATTSTR